MLIMETLFVLMAAVLANSLPRCSDYCQISSSVRRRPASLSCVCRFLAGEQQNFISHRIKRQGQASSATFISPFHNLKRGRRSLYYKTTKDYVQRPFNNSKFTFNHSTSVDYDIRLNTNEHNSKDHQTNTLNDNYLKNNIENVFNCIHLHYILLKSQENAGFSKIGKLSNDNIYKILIKIKHMNTLIVKCKQALQVIDANKEVNGGLTTQNNSIFNYLHHISLEINKFTKVTYNVNSESIQLMKTVTSIFNEKIHTAFQQASKNSHSNILRNRSNSTISINSTTLSPSLKYYDYATKTVLINEKNKKLSQSKSILDIIKVGKDDVEIHPEQIKNTTLRQNAKTHRIFDILNTPKPLFGLDATTEYSKSSKENVSFQNLVDTTDMRIKKNVIDTMNLITKTKDVSNNDYTKSLLSVSSIPLLNIINSTITPLKTIKESTIQEKLNKTLSNSVNYHKRPQYNESEIPLIRVMSREYSNNSVSSILNGTETLPSNDSEETSISYYAQNNFDVNSPKTKSYNIYGEYIPTAFTNKVLTPNAIKGKSKLLSITGKLYFVIGNQKMPVRFFQDPYENIQVGLDILDICNNIDKENHPSMSNLLSLLCNSIKLNNI